MNEVALEDAVLLWSDGPDAFAVVADWNAATDKFRHVRNSRGRCDFGWLALTTPTRLSSLMSIVWGAVIRDRVPAGVMHRALLAIPEYRGWIDHDAPGIEEWSE